MKDKSHLRQYASYTSLSVLSKISISIYILVDTFFISHVLDADGLTALNLAVPIFSFINGISLLLGMGGATKYSIFKSRRQDKESNIVFTNTIYLAAFFSILFVLIGIFFSESLTLALGANESVFEITHVYLVERFFI